MFITCTQKIEDRNVPKTAGHGSEVRLDEKSRAMARDSAQEISRLLEKLPGAVSARVRLDGRDIVLPRAVWILLRDLLDVLGRGNGATLTPTHATLTTQEAANRLQVSRPHLVKLLESGAIPFTRTGTHRRIRVQDLITYENHKRSGRKLPGEPGTLRQRIHMSAEFDTPFEEVDLLSGKR